MVVSVVTGLIVYRKWWKGFLTLERKRGARILWGGAHKLLGVWSLWFVALMAITGTWYFVEELLFDFTDFAYVGTPTLDDRELSAYGAAAPLADLDTVVESARREVPSLRVRQHQAAGEQQRCDQCGKGRRTPSWSATAPTRSISIPLAAGW